MEYLKDLKDVFVQGVKSTKDSFKFIPLLIGLQALVSVLYWLLANLFVFRGGMLGGILVALFRAALWSVYLYGLVHAIDRSRFTLKDLKAGFGVFFRDVYIAAFVLWIVQMIISVAGIPYLDYLILLVFSALPETLYLGRYQGFDNIRDSFEFLQENWYIWIPLTLIMVFLLETFGFGATLTLPIAVGGLDMQVLTLYLVHTVLFSLFALLRGHMFVQLYGSSLRRRNFMGRFR